MTEQPKRRGRPPGSKNTPKLAAITDVSGRAGGWDVSDGLRSVPIEQAGYVEAIAGAAPIKVILSTRGQAWGDPANEQAVDWPAEWRLPQPGDSVHLRKDWGGFVSSVDFDIEEGVVRVFLR